METPRGDTAYAFYESYGSIKNLNKNFVPVQEASEYPRNLYVAEPFNQSRCQPNQFKCPTGPRDPTIDYFFGTEVTVHPPHFSRFGNPWCPNGYCMGNMPGRYNTPEAFRWQTEFQTAPQYKGLAPEKFYKGEYLLPNGPTAPAYANSQNVRKAI